MKNQMQKNNSELFLIIGGLVFIVLGICLYINNLTAWYSFSLGIVLSSVYFIVMDKTSAMARGYEPIDLIDKKLSWNNRIYHIKKFVCIGNDIGICGKYECHCITNGTIEFIYEDEILQLLANDHANLI